MKKVLALTLLLLGMASFTEIQAKPAKPPKPVGGGKPDISIVSVPDNGRTVLLLATSLIAIAALRRRLAR